MATRERQPILGPVLLPAGYYTATCVAATAETSRSGNAMVVWQFELPGGRTVNHYTMRSGSGAAALHDTAAALGLGKRFRLSQAAGRRALLDLGIDGDWNRVERVRPLPS